MMAAVWVAERAEAAGRATKAATPAAPRELPKVDGARDKAIRFSGFFLGRPPELHCRARGAHEAPSSPFPFAAHALISRS